MNQAAASSGLRRAMAMCIDLQSIIANLFHGTARAISGPFTPDQWAYNPNVPVIEYNPQEALRDLRSLGWLDTDRDGLLDKGKKPLKIEMLESPPDELLMRAHYRYFLIDQHSEHWTRICKQQNIAVYSTALPPETEMRLLAIWGK